MADYYSQTVFDEDIPASAMTPIERVILEGTFQSETYGEDDPGPDRVYFFAEVGINDQFDIDATELAKAVSDTLAADPAAAGKALELARDALKDVTEADGTIEDGDVEVVVNEDWMQILQDICKRQPSVPEIVIHQAFACSKMRSDGFGGGIIRVTAGAIQTESAQSMLKKMRAEAPVA
jgi:hypothetical protein